MNVSGRTIGFVVLNMVMIGGIISFPAFGARQTFTGTVGDAMCGAKHVMPGSNIYCTQSCASKGSKYALLVGDKVYTLDTNDKAVLAMLYKQAGEKVNITGAEKDHIIAVMSVKPAQ